MSKQGSEETLNETNERLAEVLANRLKSGKIASTHIKAEELVETYDLYIRVWNNLPRE